MMVAYLPANSAEPRRSGSTKLDLQSIFKKPGGDPVNS